MAINMNSLCIRCLTQKHLQAAEKLDLQKAQGFTKDFLELMRKALDGNNSTVVAAQINRLYQQHFGLEQDRFMEEKRLSNAFIKARLPRITALVESQEDPVYAGLQFAVLGNYLDFSALGNSVSFDGDTAYAISLVYREGGKNQIQMISVLGNDLLCVDPAAGYLRITDSAFLTRLQAILEN